MRCISCRECLSLEVEVTPTSVVSAIQRVFSVALAVLVKVMVFSHQ